MRYFRFLCVLLIVAASSCNKDDVVTITLEDEHYRPRTAASQAEWSDVLEYTPAPGQYIGDTTTGGFTGEELTAADAAAYAEGRMRAGRFLSLGGFGGYVVVAFDHSIDNVEGYDIAIRTNCYEGSSEPGIVWVSQDENGDGRANDSWYELRGSESGNLATISDYAVTYYRPDAGQPVEWIDSEGATGQIDYLGAFHPQPTYYPTWITADSYTLKGTRLEARNYDSAGDGSLWVQPSYGWGYADNFSAVDLLQSEDGPENRFDIANAIDQKGSPVELRYIDFVKVQTALNTKSGWIGENSTEVYGVRDYTMNE